MSSFRIPVVLRPRHSFHRLRSFHLSPNADMQSSPTLSPELIRPRTSIHKIHCRNAPFPVRGSIVTKLAVLVSLIFIFTISFSFIGANIDEEYFKLSLEKTADTSPGIVLLGENVDVDVDEPSITIRWSIVACGEEFVLPGSAGVHGSRVCGLPSQPLHIFVDNDPTPTATYNPSKIPFSRSTGIRRSIQNLVQFDSNHVLDVHEVRLYPFDTYLLSSTFRAFSFDNESLPIQKVVTIAGTSSFDIQTMDTESYSTLVNNTENASRDMDMRVTRPGSARLFGLLLFALNWILAHVAVGLVMMSRRLGDARPTLKHSIFVVAIMVAIPQLRKSMPDAPGLDGVLIDTIGFFPQMVISGISATVILILSISRELDDVRQTGILPRKTYPTPPPAALNRPRPPPTPSKDSGSKQVSQYEMYRLNKHLQGEYVFPPVQTVHTVRPLAPHRRTKTIPKIREDSEVSHYPDWTE